MPPLDESLQRPAGAGRPGLADEQEAWWSVNPVALVSWDAARRVLRLNDAFVSLVRCRPTKLDGLPPDLLALLGVGEEPPSPGPGAGRRSEPTREHAGWVEKEKRKKQESKKPERDRKSVV